MTPADPQRTAITPPSGPAAPEHTGVFSTGPVRAAPLAQLLEEEKRSVEDKQAKPMVVGLVSHIRQCWTSAENAKQQTIEPRMLANMRARRGEYDPDKLAAIQSMGGSDIFANLTSVKCRAAASWLRDVLAATGTERPWSIRPTPVSDLPPDVNEKIVAAVAQALQVQMQAGIIASDMELRQAIAEVKEEAKNALQQEARRKADTMADKMEDQLVEGGFIHALDAFLEDITTFPCAILKGPVVRKRKMLKWVQGKDGKYTPEPTDTLKLEWERVSPFNIYPSPEATTVDDGYLIEKHRLSREDLNALIGVEGYDDEAIRQVIRDYGTGGLRDWTRNETAIADAEGKSTPHVALNDDSLIDALQFWGPVSGQMLLDWGMSADEVLDATQEYHVEAWLIGNYCIKAVLNYDPMCRKPYFKASYEDVPGSWWGHSVADLVRPTQQVVNAAARAIVNNMGIASGPQVQVNIDRLAAGEQVTQLTPWRIWQTTTNPMGGSERPVDFFQPNSNIGELMGVFEKFSQLSDEYSGLPKYMAGDSAGGAGRTASGLSMLMGNAGKAIKQVVANIDIGVMTPMLTMLYDHNMRFAEDPDLKGDVQIVARGASSLVQKEAAQLRRNEFLAATANPIDMSIMGVEGRAAVLREAAKNLDMDVDKVVPPLNKLRTKMAMQAMMANGPQAQPAQGGDQMGSGQALEDGSPTVDNFSPPAQ